MSVEAIVAIVCGVASVVAGVLLGRERRIGRQAEARAVKEERRAAIRSKIDRRKADVQAERERRLALAEARHLQKARRLSAEADKIMAADGLEEIAKLWNSRKDGDE